MSNKIIKDPVNGIDLIRIKSASHMSGECCRGCYYKRKDGECNCPQPNNLWSRSYKGELWCTKIVAGIRQCFIFVKAF